MRAGHPRRGSRSRELPDRGVLVAQWVRWKRQSECSRLRAFPNLSSASRRCSVPIRSKHFALRRFEAWRASQHHVRVVLDERERSKIECCRVGRWRCCSPMSRAARSAGKRTAKRWAPPLKRHDAILSEIIQANRGYTFKRLGDAFCAAFSTVPQAIAAAYAAQRALLAEDFSAVNGLKVRMAVHAGHTEERNGDYFGPVLNRVARLLAIGSGSQVLVSGAAADLCRARCLRKRICAIWARTD